MISKLNIFFDYLLGYVEVKIEGYFAERLVNKAKMKQMVIWEVKRDKTLIIYAKVRNQDFKELSIMATENKCELSVIKEFGIPFILKRYKKRKTFFISIILMLLILFTVSRFIWNIQIEGIENIGKEEIINELKENGLKIGGLKNRVNTNDVINKIRLKRKDISWIGIELIRNKC